VSRTGQVRCRAAVRAILPKIRQPTLVLHRTGDLTISVEEGRYLAKHVPAARMVELPGEDHLWWVGNSDLIVGEIEEFLTGERPAVEPDRVLATVLFTDIVASTERAAAVGDRRWRNLLANHDAVVRKEVARHRGTTVKSTGDGLLATFDGPTRAIRCAVDIRRQTADLGFELRIGLHTGEIELTGADIGGMSVNVAARVLERAGSGEIWASGTVKDLVIGTPIEFDRRGDFDLKGVPGTWPLYAVEATT
jgi:class 3 adenylate cyclase